MQSSTHNLISSVNCRMHFEKRSIWELDLTIQRPWHFQNQLHSTGFGHLRDITAQHETEMARHRQYDGNCATVQIVNFLCSVRQICIVLYCSYDKEESCSVWSQAIRFLVDKHIQQELNRIRQKLAIKMNNLDCSFELTRGRLVISFSVNSSWQENFDHSLLRMIQ